MVHEDLRQAIQWQANNFILFRQVVGGKGGYRISVNVSP